MQLSSTVKDRGQHDDLLKELSTSQQLREYCQMRRGRPRKRRFFNFMRCRQVEQPVHSKENDQNEEQTGTIVKDNKQKRNCPSESTIEGSEIETIKIKETIGLEIKNVEKFNSENQVNNHDQGKLDVTAVDSVQRDFLSEVTVESNDVNSDDQHSFTLKGNRRKRNLLKWSNEEKQVTEEFFLRHIKMRISPKKQEVLQLMKLYPNLFNDRKWDVIKVYVCNKYKSERKIALSPIPTDSIKVERDGIPFISVQSIQNDHLSPLHTDIKEEPTRLIENTDPLSLLTLETENKQKPIIDVDPLRDEYIKTDVEINVKKEPRNESDFGLEVDMEEEVESDTINEQEKIKRHRLFIVTQSPPLIEKDEIKEVIADPLQVMEPVVKELPSFKSSISIRDIRTLTQKIPTHMQSQLPTVPLKLRKVSPTEALLAVLKKPPMIRISRSEIKQYPVKENKLKHPPNVFKPRFDSELLNRYFLKPKLPNQKDEDSGNDLLNHMRKQIRVISVNLSNKKKTMKPTAIHNERNKVKEGS